MRAKSHDQRKGQWIINKLRTNPEYENAFKKSYQSGDPFEWKALVEQLLWFMENDEFDKYMKEYDK